MTLFTEMGIKPDYFLLYGIQNYYHTLLKIPSTKVRREKNGKDEINIWILGQELEIDSENILEKRY